MKSYPLSILIPTYNRRALLEETLNSIFKDKASKEVEVVVVDDGSQDETWAYLCTLKETYPNLKIYRHEKNLGVSSARNTALALATGSYLMFLDSDDYFTESGLERLLEKINDKEEVYLISVWIERKNKRKPKIFPDPPSDPILRLKSFINGLYADAIYVIKKNLFENIKFRFNTHLMVREDWVLQGLIFALISFDMIREPLIFKRDHPQRLRNVPEFYENSILLSVEELFNRLPSSFQILYSYALAKAYIELGTKFMRVKDYEKAFFYFQKAKEAYPVIKREFKFFKKWLKSYFFHKVLRFMG